MKKATIILCLSLIGATMITSCKKEGCTDSTATNYDKKAKKDNGTCEYPVPVVADGFRWKENGGTENVADSAFWTTWASGTGIRAYKGGMANFFEINWTPQNNTSVGAKSLAAGDITFLTGGSSYSNSATATVNVTIFSNDKMTGNFTTTVSGSSSKTIDATFGNLPKK